MYARFWHKVLYDIGVVPTKEPFQKLFNQGMILGEGNEKMSKSKGNVVNPDDIVESHGADTLRVYEMFMGPLDASIAWSENGLDGSRRFLDRVYRLFVNEDGTLSQKVQNKTNESLEKVYHQTVQKVTEDIDKLGFNTAISQLMVFVNECYKQDVIPVEYATGFIKLLSPFAPHIGEEIYNVVGHEESIAYASWPTYDESKLVEDHVEIVVQIKGKVKAKLNIPQDATKEEMEQLALADEKVKEAIGDKEIIKVIAVPKKLVNIVTKG